VSGALPTKVLVYGLGRSGGAAARLLRQQGAEVWTFDARAPQGDDLTALGCHRTDTPLTTPTQLCVAAPGVPYDAPDLQALRAKGLETIGEVEWVYRSVAAEIIGITGTAGKTTTTRLVSHILTQAGLNAPAGGNVDPALSAVAEPGATLVTELSSFQLERCPTLKPSIAVILNLGVDHLDRYSSVAAYHDAKRQLLKNLGANETFIYNHDDPLLPTWAAETPARAWCFSEHDPTADAYLSGDTLILHGRVLLEADDLHLTGRHHLVNALAAALVCSAKGLPDDAIQQGLRSFRGVPGRYSLVGEAAGVRFIEDSIATRTLAVQRALEATPGPIAWLVGGQDKGADLAALEPLVRERVTHCIGFGEAGKAFLQTLEPWSQTHYIAGATGDETMESAVALATETLKATGGTVLLAPLGASFDQFHDYKARAGSFRRAAQRALERLNSETEAAWTLSY
jgi:UDP-N-acetylmuramoylalanine--D-glutamate ligase